MIRQKAIRTAELSLEHLSRIFRHRGNVRYAVLPNQILQSIPKRMPDLGVNEKSCDSHSVADCRIFCGENEIRTRDTL